MADPAFETGGGAGGSGARPKIFSVNLGDFLKNLAQKGVGVPPPSGSAPGTLYKCYKNVLCLLGRPNYSDFPDDRL